MGFYLAIKRLDRRVFVFFVVPALITYVHTPHAKRLFNNRYYTMNDLNIFKF